MISAWRRSSWWRMVRGFTARRSYDLAPMEHLFGRAAPFALGVEEELLLVDTATGELAPVASTLIPGLAPEAGTIEPDVYEALVELASPITANAVEGTRALAA